MRKREREKARRNSENRDLERKAARTGIPVSQLSKPKKKKSK